MEEKIDYREIFAGVILAAVFIPCVLIAIFLCHEEAGAITTKDRHSAKQPERKK